MAFAGRGSGAGRWLAGGLWCAGTAFALAHCGTSANPSEFGINDSGAPPTIGADATAPVVTDSAPPPSLTSDSGGSSNDDGSVLVGDDEEGDANYVFGGFDHPDGFSEASYCTDDDGDGFTTCNGDCDDHDSLVNPCAFDTNAASGDPVGSDGIDNDCDGQIDNRVICDTGITAGQSTTAMDYANAMELCNNPLCPVVQSVTFTKLSSNEARRVTPHMGLFTPHAGSLMTYLSSGIAEDDVDTTPATNPYHPGDGTDFSDTGKNPDPLTSAQNTNECGNAGADESKVNANDMVELTLVLKAPINAGAFAFDFNFFSEEYPSYVCAGFNDTFLAELTSIKYPIGTYPAGFQIAFDSAGHRVNVNNGFFSDCTSETSYSPGGGGGKFTHACSGALSLLDTTGYEIKYNGSGPPGNTVGNGNQGSGATDWLKTTAPIQAGETFTISFYIFDEDDGILDSAINLDNFRWGSIPVTNPITAR